MTFSFCLRDVLTHTQDEMWLHTGIHQASPPYEQAKLNSNMSGVSRSSAIFLYNVSTVRFYAEKHNVYIVFGVKGPARLPKK